MQQASPRSLHQLLDQKIKEVGKMRDMLDKELNEISATAQVKARIVQAAQMMKGAMVVLREVVAGAKSIPGMISQINSQWGQILLKEKQDATNKERQTENKYRIEVHELQEQLKKQYDTTRSMKVEVEGLKKLIDEFMASKERNVSPIKSMTEQKQPVLDVIVQEEEITSTKRGQDPLDQTIQSLLRRNKTQERMANKEYITLGNLHEIVRTNSAQRPLSDKRLELTGIDVYYKKNRIYYPTTEQSRSEISLSEASSTRFNQASIQQIGKILSKNYKEKLFTKRRESEESRKSRATKDAMCFLESDDEEKRTGLSFWDRVNKENIQAEFSKDRMTKQEKYKTMIKSILTSKDKETLTKHRKKQLILNVGDKKMEVKYQGSKKDGKRHGKGVLYYTNGLSYQGEFKNGARSGYGVLRFNHIQIYNGDWENDAMNGEGRIKNCSIIGSKKKDLPSVLQRWISFSGQFKNNKFCGSGTLYMSGNQKYLGMFKNGFPCNQGTLYRSSGEVEFGMWKGSTFVAKF